MLGDGVYRQARRTAAAIIPVAVVFIVWDAIRFPWDIPVEDFLFGWAMVTAVLLLWVRGGDRQERKTV